MSVDNQKWNCDEEAKDTRPDVSRTLEMLEMLIFYFMDGLRQVKCRNVQDLA